MSRLCQPTADVQSWDGTSRHEFRDVQTPHVIQPAAAFSTLMAMRHGSTQGTLTQVAAQATPTSTLRGKWTPSSILLRSTSTETVKTRSLHEIYEVGTPNSFSL